MPVNFISSLEDKKKKKASVYTWNNDKDPVADLI